METIKIDRSFLSKAQFDLAVQYLTSTFTQNPQPFNSNIFSHALPLVTPSVTLPLFTYFAINHSLTVRSRKALLMTETELRLIAAPAMIGLSSKPKNG